MPFLTVNYPSVPHTWVLANRVDQLSHVTKVAAVKVNVTQFIGGNLITTSTQYPNWHHSQGKVNECCEDLISIVSTK